MTALLLALTLAASDVATFGFGLVIASDSDCPSAHAVRDGLNVLSFPSPDAASVAVHADEDEVHVVFAAPAGLQRGPRKLALLPDCERRASTVALLIAAWLGQLPSTPPPSMTLEAAPPPPPAPPPRPLRAAPPRKQTLHAGIGLAGGVGETGGLDVGLRLELGRGTTEPGPGWSVGLAAPLVAHTVPYPGGGGSRWARATAAFDLRLRTSSRVVDNDWYFGPVLGLTFAWGEGLVNRRDFPFDLGLNGAVRFTLPHRRLAPWIEVRGRLWLVNHDIEPAQERWSLGSGTPLSAAEVELALGWSWFGS